MTVFHITYTHTSTVSVSHADTRTHTVKHKHMLSSSLSLFLRSLSPSLSLKHTHIHSHTFTKSVHLNTELLLFWKGGDGGQAVEWEETRRCPAVHSKDNCLFVFHHVHLSVCRSRLRSLSHRSRNVFFFCFKNVHIFTSLEVFMSFLNEDWDSFPLSFML